jgi:hypothetical protein
MRLVSNDVVWAAIPTTRTTMEATSASATILRCVTRSAASARGRVCRRPPVAVVRWLGHRGGLNRSPRVYRCLSPRDHPLLRDFLRHG